MYYFLGLFLKVTVSIPNSKVPLIVFAMVILRNLLWRSQAMANCFWVNDVHVSFGII